MEDESQLAPPPGLNSLIMAPEKFNIKKLSQERVSLSLFDEASQNLSMSQQEPLLWHNCLDHVHMKLLKCLFDVGAIAEAVLQAKHPKTCIIPICAA